MSINHQEAGAPTRFYDTAEAADFRATANSREAAPEIMDAITWFARDTAEAEAVWEGSGIGVVCHISDIVERVTGNGMRGQPEDFCWGAAGCNWAMEA